MFSTAINTPGYMPWDDSTTEFDTAREAWDYLLDSRRDQEDDAIMAGLGTGDGYSETLNRLEQAADGQWDDLGLDPLDGQGTIYGDTPGYDGDHDLGLAYSVIDLDMV
jgi:hypothetical protein